MKAENEAKDSVKQEPLGMDTDTAAVKAEGPAGVKAEQQDVTASTAPADDRWAQALQAAHYHIVPQTTLEAGVKLNRPQCCPFQVVAADAA